MNMHQPRHFGSNLTSKGQVTIPKEIRDILGLKPGDRVVFVLEGDGHARIVRVDDNAEIARREAEITRGVQEARRLFKAENTLGDMTNREWYELMRGPPPEV